MIIPNRDKKREYLYNKAEKEEKINFPFIRKEYKKMKTKQEDVKKAVQLLKEELTNAKVQYQDFMNNIAYEEAQEIKEYTER